jgi:hypothetical protein
MKAIKGLVIFMGLLLVAGLGLLGYGMSIKAHQTGPRAAAGAAAGAGSLFGAVEVPLAAGAHVEQMVVAGDRVVLRVLGAGPERLVVLDPGQGRVAGSFVMTPEPPMPPALAR